MWVSCSSLQDQLRGQNEQSAWAQPPLIDTKQAAVGVPVYAASVSVPFAEGNYRRADSHGVPQGQALRSTTAVLRGEQKKSTPQYSPLLLHDLTKRLNQQEMVGCMSQFVMSLGMFISLWWWLQEIASLRLALAKVEERNGEHEGDIRQLKGVVKIDVQPTLFSIKHVHSTCQQQRHLTSVTVSP